MKTMIACCGLNCETCPVHLATLEPDKAIRLLMRASIAETCTSIYGMNVLADDINDCDGCRTNTRRIFSGCLDCGIRKCAGEKNIGSCAYCNDYACDMLQKHFSLDPGAQIRLEEIRQRDGK